MFSVGSWFCEAYYFASRDAHKEPPVRLNPAFVLEYSPDVATKLDIAPSGLSRTACLCPSCPYYLKCLGASNIANKVCPALKAHLADVPAVPGLHKYIFETARKLDGESHGAFVKRVVQTVKLGWHLEATHPSKHFKGDESDSARETKQDERDVHEEYRKNMLERFHSEFSRDEYLEAAVSVVYSTPVLGRDETLEALSRIYPRV